MKNYGIIHFKDANIDNFTSNIGMNIRKKLDKPLSKILKLATKEKIIIDNYPELEKDEAYIFTSLHRFTDDTIANLATIDRNAYLLFGTTDQLKNNKSMYAAWANGFIYVDRTNKDNRSDALLKMERVLKNGNSVLIFPEGGFNNTENLLCQKLFASPYILAKRTGAKIVPIAPFYEFGSNEIYMNVGEPIDLAKFEDKKEALLYLRDVLSTLLWESIEKHSTPIIRNELGPDPRLDFMEERRQEYMKNKWGSDVWDEELTRYYDKEEREYNAMFEELDNANLTNMDKSALAPLLVKRLEQKKYDFKDYMHKNWNK